MFHFMSGDYGSVRSDLKVLPREGDWITFTGNDGIADRVVKVVANGVPRDDQPDAWVYLS